MRHCYRFPRTFCLATTSVLLFSSLALGQSADRTSLTSTNFSATTGTNNPALRYFGGTALLQPSSRRPALQLPALAPMPKRPIRKPFAGATLGSPVSPYLALDLRESGSGLPNYYAFVRPQLQQQRQFELQQAQYQMLQQQVRSSGATAGSPSGSRASMPTTGHSTQFQNLGGYFPGR